MVPISRRRDRVFGVEAAIISSHHSGSAQFAIRRVRGQVLDGSITFRGKEEHWSASRELTRVITGGERGAGDKRDSST